MTSAETIAKRLAARMSKALKGKQPNEEVEVFYQDPNGHELAAIYMTDGDGGMCWFVSEKVGEQYRVTHYTEDIESNL